MGGKQVGTERDEGMFLGRKLSGAVYATLIHEAVNVSAGERTLILGMAIVNQPTCEREVAKARIISSSDSGRNRI